MNSEIKNKSIRLTFKCPYCWYAISREYVDYNIACKDKVYCDECITRRALCITPGYQELISSLL